MNKYAQKDYYGILGINIDASQDEIKKAFRQAAVKYHPDINTGGEKIFLEIKEAYEVLINPSERKKYDFIKGIDLKRARTRFEREYKYSFDFKDKYAETASKTSSESKFETKKTTRTNKTVTDTIKEIFKSFSNRNKDEFRQETDKPVDGRDITMPVEISYKEAINGTNRKINVLHTEICPMCYGRKFSDGSSCRYCKGKGEVSLHKKINVKIPCGSTDGKKIRLKGEGTKGLNGGKNGNLYLVISIKDDSGFKFDGNNVYTELSISPYEAALGCIAEVMTLSGKVKLKIPEGTSSGQKFRLANEGLFDENKKAKGNQIITVHITLNGCMTQRERELYEELKNISREIRN